MCLFVAVQTDQASLLKMKAVQASEKGLGHLKFISTALPRKEIGPNQLLVRIEAAALNPVDWKMLEYGFIVEDYPHIFGCDGSGEVVAVGEAVQRFKVGDKVWAFTDLKAPSSGTFAEHAVFDEDLTGRRPGSVSAESAAALGVGALTAALMFWGSLQGDDEKLRGKAIVIYGASSSVGMYCVQLAALAQRTVIAVASKRNHQLLKELGAEVTLDYHDNDWKERAREQLKDGRQVIDNIGGSAAKDCLDLLVPNGGAIASTDPNGLPEDLFSSKPDNVTCTGAFLAGAYDNSSLRKEVSAYISRVDQLLATGKLQPNPVEVLQNGLAAVPGGLQRLKAGKVSGLKLVARIADTPLS